MAKKRPSESFAHDDITFEFDGMRCRLLLLNPNDMTVTIQPVESGTTKTIPFAHLPKQVKQTIRPLK